MINFYPSRKLGQNFTVDPTVVFKTVKTIKELNPTALLEIGVGTGVLTKGLLKLNLPYHGIELDKRLAQHLLDNEVLTNDQLTTGDALKQDFNSFFVDKLPLLCGNIPYSISSPLIAHFLKSNLKIFVLVCQLELAQRLTAEVNSANYSAFGVFCQYHLHIKTVFTIDKVAFKPKPKVDSALVVLQKRENIVYDHQFGVFLKQCFHHRRKLLLNNLKPYFDHDLLNQQLKTQNLLSTVRAQELTPQQLFTFYLALSHGKN